MYSFIRGNILFKDMQSIGILAENTGIGFEIFVSPQILWKYQINENISLLLHHHITDVSQTLFGFETESEKNLFRSLIRVSGIGGKTALNMLAIGTSELLQAIENEDDKILSSIPGIGKKTAQKIIVDLKGSIHFNENTKWSSEKTQNVSSGLHSSLVGMGYDKNRVEAIIATIDPNLSVEEQAKIAIKLLS